jgi:hypothetical protein
LDFRTLVWDLRTTGRRKYRRTTPSPGAVLGWVGLAHPLAAAQSLGLDR